VYTVRATRNLPVFPVGCGTGILRIPVLRHGHANPNSNPNTNYNSNPNPTNPNCNSERINLHLFDEEHKTTTVIRLTLPRLTSATVAVTGDKLTTLVAWQVAD